MDYRYPHFSRELLREDATFQSGPWPGDPLPNFDLPTADGGRVRRSDFIDKRPLLLTLGSFT